MKTLMTDMHLVHSTIDRIRTVQLLEGPLLMPVLLVRAGGTLNAYLSTGGSYYHEMPVLRGRELVWRARRFDAFTGEAVPRNVNGRSDQLWRIEVEEIGQDTVELLIPDNLLAYWRWLLIG